MVRFRNALTVIAVAVTLATGCGTDPAPETTLNVAELDSGNYPSVPRDLAELRASQYGPLREAARIGAVTSLIIESDDRFPFQRLSNPERRSVPGGDAIRGQYSLSDEEFAELAQGFSTGWQTSAERRSPVWLGRQVSLQILRYSDASAASAAGDRLAERQARNLPGESLRLADFAQAHVKWSPSQKYLDVWLAHDSLLLALHIDDPVSEPAEAAPLLEISHRILVDEIEALKSYAPTPIAEFDSIPVDVDGLLSRTLPLEDSQKRMTYDQSMLLSARAALHYEIHPASSKAAFENSGVDLVSFSGGRVYRARDAAGAARLMAALIAQNSVGWKPMDRPPNMPMVECFGTEDKTMNVSWYPPVCFVPIGRFVARVTGKNPQELYQKAAAQYKLLVSE